jgi:hypothetical protein
MIQEAGNVINAWRSPEAPADASVNFPFYVELVQKAERMALPLLQMVFLLDTKNRTCRNTFYVIQRTIQCSKTTRFNLQN